MQKGSEGFSRDRIGTPTQGPSLLGLFWVAVKELELSCRNSKTILITMSILLQLNVSSLRATQFFGELFRDHFDSGPPESLSRPAPYLARAHGDSSMALMADSVSSDVMSLSCFMDPSSNTPDLRGTKAVEWMLKVFAMSARRKPV